MVRVNTRGQTKRFTMMEFGFRIHVMVRQLPPTSTKAKSRNMKATLVKTRDKATANFISVIKVFTKENGKTT